SSPIMPSPPWSRGGSGLRGRAGSEPVGCGAHLDAVYRSGRAPRWRPRDPEDGIGHADPGSSSELLPFQAIKPSKAGDNRKLRGVVHRTTRSERPGTLAQGDAGGTARLLFSLPRLEPRIGDVSLWTPGSGSMGERALNGRVFLKNRLWSRLPVLQS